MQDYSNLPLFPLQPETKEIFLLDELTRLRDEISALRAELATVEARHREFFDISVAIQEAQEEKIAALRADKHRLIQDAMECSEGRDSSEEYYKEEIKELREQLAAAQAEQWQPVADGRYGRIIVRDGTLQVPHGGVDPLAAPIPAGYAFCRKG